MKKQKHFLFLIAALLVFLSIGCGKVSNPDGQPELGRTRSVTFCLHNLMTYDIYIEVSEVCNHDWQSQNRPERLQRAYTPGETFYHQMDMNAWDRTFPATLTFYRWDPVHSVKVGAALDKWRMTDMNAIEQPWVEQMTSGYRGKIQVITSKGGSGVHAALVPANLSLADWVSDMPDTAYISELSFPGTHDSGTFNYTGALSPWVVCQSRSFTSTFNKGCRAFDVRLAPDSDNELKIVHGNYNTGLKLTTSFLTDCKNLLASHPRETIIARLQKDDGSADTVKTVLDTILNESTWKDMIYTVSTSEYPRIADVRGKLVLIYDGGIYDSRSKGYWLNYSSDTSEELVHNSDSPNLKWFVHDNYQATNPDMKISHVNAYFNDLVSLSYQEKDVMPICFLSAAEHNFWTALNTPMYFAGQVNPYECGKIAELNPTKRLGLVYSDYFGGLSSSDSANGLGYLVVAKNYYKHNLIQIP